MNDYIKFEMSKDGKISSAIVEAQRVTISADKINISK